MKSKIKYSILIILTCLFVGVFVVFFIQLHKSNEATIADMRKSIAYQKNAFFNFPFTGKIISKKEYPKNEAIPYRVYVKLDSLNRNSAFPITFSFYYQYESVDGGHEGLTELAVSKFVYYYCREGDVIEKDSCSDSIKVNKRKFLLFSKDKSEWVPHSN